MWVKHTQHSEAYPAYAEAYPAYPLVQPMMYTLLPPPSIASQYYNLRRDTHVQTLPEHDTYLSDCNFITCLQVV